MSAKDRRIQRKVRHSYIISTVSIALVLFMLGVVSYVTLSALSAAHDLRGSVVVSVELGHDVDEEVRQQVLESIEATGVCDDVEFLDRESKFSDEEFRRQFDVDLDMLLGENPLRDSYEVTLDEGCTSREQVEAFVREVELIEGVEYVAVPPVDIIESMHATLRYVSLGLLVFFGVLFIISMLLLNNTIRLAIYSKRYLINTMKLVGATKWYIMRPLLGSALKQGLVAGIVAALMICGVVYGAESYTIEGLRMLDYREVGIIVGVVVAIGVVITLLFSIFAVNKFVNMKSSHIHLY
ncbi:MAG: FtsX-like permease family protein [Rikenellaceae bacterium]|nr:FtsX-like permease family protein [Rikenellaceae bacterium]